MTPSLFLLEMLASGKAIEMPRMVLEKTAQIIGPDSASRHALDELKRRLSAGEDAACYRIGMELIVGPRPTREGL
jgi:hypothetical protein